MFRINDVLTRALAITGGLVILVMMLQVALDVMARNLLNAPLPGTLDFIRFWWMPLIVFLSLPYVHLQGAHIEVTLLVDGARRSAHRISQIFASIVGFVTVTVFLYYGVAEAQFSANLKEAALGTAVVPIWIPKIIMCIGLAVLLIQIVILEVQRSRSNFVSISSGVKNAQSEGS